MSPPRCAPAQLPHLCRDVSTMDSGAPELRWLQLAPGQDGFDQGGQRSQESRLDAEVL